MLTITHTFTERDFDLIRNNLAKRMKAGMTARVRWPFRLAYLIVGMAILVISVSDARGNASIELICLIFGVLIICIAIAPYVLTWFTLMRIRKLLKRRVGSTANWEINENGITFVGKYSPWTSFRSYSFTEAGVVLDGTNQMWIPESALSDTSTRTGVHDILEKHLKHTA